MDLSQHVALVTGASSGIGLAVARAFAARGAKVALVARTAQKLEQLADELGRERAASFPLDVKDRSGLQALPARVVERFGRLDLVVNNAGVNHRGALSERSAAEVLEIIETNLVAPMLLTHAALPLLSRGGAVINIASLAGKVPVPHESSYCASKAGLRAFSRSLDLELAERGVRIHSICPGPVDTGFFADLAQVPDLVFSQPMSSAEDIAQAVLRALDSGTQELDVPALSGKLATVGYLVPSFYTALRPALERRGAKNKARYVAQRQGK